MQRRREAILTAAQNLLANEDLNAFSVRKLAAEAGVSVATIYNLIGDRQAVLFAIVTHLTNEIGAHQRDVDGASVFDFVEAYLKALLSFTTSRENLLRSANLAFDQLSRDTDWSASTSEIVKRAETAYLGAITRGVAAGELRGDVSAAVLSELVYRSYLDATIHWAYRRLSMTQYKRRVQRDALIVLLADATESSRPTALARLSR